MQDYFWWTVLILTLVGATYAAFVIKNEKKVAISDGLPLQFHGFEVIIPRWWTRTFESENKITFERTDTRYEWYANFYWLPNIEHDLQTTFEIMATERGLIFDEDTSIIYAPSMLEEIKEQGIEALRVEGTATERAEHRVYYDAFIIKGDNGHLYLESRSSILNGLLEGPFFEQAISKIKKI